MRLLDRRASLAGITPDGKTVLYTNLGNCLVLRIDGDPERPSVAPPKPCFPGDQGPAFAELSPGGRWLAYVAASQGNRSEIFVRSFPDRGGRWQVSASGGTRPRWARNSPGLFFVSENGELMSVRYRVDSDSFSVGSPRKWSSANPVIGSYSPAPDGKSVLMMVSNEPPHEAEARICVLLNFFDEIRRQIRGDRP